MRITDIQYFSLDDGPGIRTTVFLSGCNLKCLWCHNPENLESERFDYEISIENLLEQIMKDKDIIMYNGGVTFSGGDPMLQFKELKTILKLCKENGLHTTIETAGSYSFDLIDELKKYIDLVIIDCKAFTTEIHKECTGVDNKLILDNINKMHEEKMKYWVRIPVVPNLNINLEEIKKISQFLQGKDIERVELIPYHEWGIKKYNDLEIDYLAKEAKVPTKQYMEMCINELKSCNLPVYF